MRLVCARPHYTCPDESVVCETLGAWLFHQVIHCHRLRSRLIEIGFLDAKTEGERLFWRWDYYNALEAARRRAYDRRIWEGKRAATRARWGETAA